MRTMVPVVGRDHDVDMVLERLAASGSCSIVGPGGIGKSTVARAVAERTGRPLVWLEGEAIDDSATVAAALARVVGTEVLPGEDALGAVVAGLDGREVVVVLDGIEHLPGTESLVAAVSTAATGPWWLITTRRVPAPPPAWRLRPLGLEGGRDADAQRLLRSLLDALGEPDALSADQGATALVMTGGLPLAIELLARRLAAGAEADAELPPAGSRSALPPDVDVDPALVASVARSLDLVDDPTTACFRRLAVCGPRPTLDDIAGSTALPMAAVRAALEQLRHVGLVAPIGDRYDVLAPIRDVAWHLLGAKDEIEEALDVAVAWAESVAGAAVGDTHRAPDVQPQVEHLVHLAWLAVRHGHARAGPLVSALFEPLSRRMWYREYLALLTAALRSDDDPAWSIDAFRRAALAASACASAEEASAWLARADAAVDTSNLATRCRIESTRALLAVDAGELDRARAAAERCVELGGDGPQAQATIWLARHDLALIALQAGDLTRCEHLASECVAWSREHDRELAWLAEVELAWADLERGRWSQAAARARRMRQEIETALGHATEVSEETRAIEVSAEPAFDGEQWDDRRDRSWWLRLTSRLAHAGAAPVDSHATWVMRVAADVVALAESIPLAYPQVTGCVLLGDAALAAGEPRQARLAYERALRDAVRHGFRLRAADALDGLAALAGSIGDDRMARRATGLADGIREACGAHPWPRPSLPGRPTESETPPAGWLDDGRPTDVALAALTAEPGERLADPVDPAEPVWTVLTRSEREVAQLAASGASNREIAEQLFVSRRTVESHLQRVYRKLDLHSRTQLAHLVLTTSVADDSAP